MRILANILLLVLICGTPVPVKAEEPEFSARLLVSNPAPFVGEEIDLMLEISYRGHPDGKTRFNWPGLDPFVADDRQRVRSQSARDEQDRLIETVSRRIRPLQPGTLQLQNAVVISGDTRLTLEPLTLRVRPLPVTGRPEEFQDRIGDYRLRLEADGTGPRVIRLHIDDSTLLAPVPAISPSAGTAAQLLRLDSKTERTAKGGREHTLSFFYHPAGEGESPLRFAFPAFDPLNSAYYMAETGPAPRSNPLPLARIGTALLLMLVAGLALRRRHRPRTIEGCLQNLCRRPVAGLSRDKIRGLLQPRLDRHGMEALQQYWDNRDACEFKRQRHAVQADTAQAFKALRRALWKAIDKQQDIP